MALCDPASKDPCFLSLSRPRSLHLRQSSEARHSTPPPLHRHTPSAVDASSVSALCVCVLSKCTQLNLCTFPTKNSAVHGAEVLPLYVIFNISQFGCHRTGCEIPAQKKKYVGKIRDRNLKSWKNFGCWWLFSFFRLEVLEHL